MNTSLLQWALKLVIGTAETPKSKSKLNQPKNQTNLTTKHQTLLHVSCLLRIFLRVQMSIALLACKLQFKAQCPIFVELLV